MDTKTTRRVTEVLRTLATEVYYGLNLAFTLSDLTEEDGGKTLDAIEKLVVRAREAREAREAKKVAT